MEHLSLRRRIYDRGLKALLYFCGILTCALLAFLIIYVFYRGLSGINWEFLTSQRSYINNTDGIFPNILNTLYIIFLAMIIVLPLGVGAAIYLTEYAENRKLVAVIEFATETLTGIPSIIFGLVGMLVFVQLCGMGTGILAGGLTLVVMILPTIVRTTQESLKTVPQSYREGALGLGAGILAGGLTLVMMILPTIVRTTQESLKTVPQAYREGALALGAGKWRMIRTVVLPGAVDGIVTGCILAIGRITGESAALLFTAGFGLKLNNFVKALHSSSATLTVALYVYASEQGKIDVAFAIALILLALTLIINLGANYAGKKLRRN